MLRRKETHRSRLITMGFIGH
nr:unnamed protein product [Callosobruchus analis]